MNEKDKLKENILKECNKLALLLGNDEMWHHNFEKIEIWVHAEK